MLTEGRAYFFNRAHEIPTPLVIGIAHGLLTSSITLFLKQTIKEIFLRTTRWLSIVLPHLAAFQMSLVLLTATHELAGTPALIETFSVPLTVSPRYAFLRTITLSHHA